MLQTRGGLFSTLVAQECIEIHGNMVRYSPSRPIFPGDGKVREHPHDRSPWLILCVILLTTVAASLNQFKVPPILPLLMDAFHMPAGQAGLLMSVFAVCLKIPSTNS